jgi:hypothetical protein
MKLTEQEFRDHMNSMIEAGQLKQARLWAESGTLIYVNCDELQELYDEEYRDQVER